MLAVAASSAVEAAAYEALAASAALTALAPVFQHVPEGTDPPAVIVADIDEDPEGFAGKDDDEDCKLSLTVVAIFRGEERKPLFAMEREARLALKDLRVARDGWDLAFTYAGKDGSLMEDGVTYVGNSRFTVTAFATD